MLNEEQKKMLDSMADDIASKLDEIFTSGRCNVEDDEDSQDVEDECKQPTETHDHTTCECTCCQSVEAIEVKIAAAILNQNSDFMNLKERITKENMSSVKMIMGVKQLKKIIPRLKQNMAQEIFNYVYANLWLEIVTEQLDGKLKH